MVRAFLEQIIRDPGTSFYIGVFQDHIEKSTWHYHLEYEFSFITEGTGKRIVGDATEHFSPGDMTFIGPRLPHVWIPSGEYGALHTGRTLESVYLLFNQDIFPPALLSLPEFSNVRKAMRYAERGLKLLGDALNRTSAIMLQLPYLGNFQRLIRFYEIMDIIGASTDHQYLLSEGYKKKQFNSANARINMIHEYMMGNYHEQITLEDIAKHVHMAPGSVSRMFSKETGMTVFEYLNLIKVELSIQLLLHTDISIESICYDSGFNNLSHFNRQFKTVTGRTPGVYRKEHLL